MIEKDQGFLMQQQFRVIILLTYIHVLAVKLYANEGLSVLANDLVGHKLLIGLYGLVLVLAAD